VKEIALLLSVVVAAGCGGSKSSSQGSTGGPPFLEGLTVNNETPIELNCRGNQALEAQDMPFSNKDQFRAAYPGMKDALEKGKEYATGFGPVLNGQLLETCQVTQSGRTLETWVRLEGPRGGNEH
jgi:hypothetical protein